MASTSKAAALFFFPVEHPRPRIDFAHVGRKCAARAFNATAIRQHTDFCYYFIGAPHRAKMIVMSTLYPSK